MPTHYKGSQRDIRALSAYINLERASGSVSARLQRGLEAEGLTEGQFGVLDALLHLGPMCPKDLAQKLLRSGGNITTVLDNLEKHGLVCREQIQEDRRKTLIRLTPAGEQLIAGFFPTHVAAVVKEMSRLSAQEQEELRRLCRKLGRGK